MLEFIRIMIEGKRDERGASAVEYGLLVAGIAVVIIIAVFLLGDTLSSLFNDTADEISNPT